MEKVQSTRKPLLTGGRQICPWYITAPKNLSSRVLQTNPYSNCDPIQNKSCYCGTAWGISKAPFGFFLLTNARCICSESTFLGAGNSLLCALEEEEEDEDKVPWKDAATRWQTQFNQHKIISEALWAWTSLQFLLEVLLPWASHACEFRGVGIVKHWGPTWPGRESGSALHLNFHFISFQLCWALQTGSSLPAELRNS